MPVDVARPDGPQQDQGAVGRGEEDLPGHPHQASGPDRFRRAEAARQGRRAVGPDRQAGDREVRSGGEAEASRLRRKSLIRSRSCNTEINK